MPSEINEAARARSELPDAVVRAQLERVLTSEVFSRSQQLRRFLAFIVEQQLTGHGHSIKESVLAHELYGKGTDFDGGTDPVVRVDARRLRDKLREYYDGRSDPVVISLPKGSYVPALRIEFRLTHPHNSCSCFSGAAADAARSGHQALEDRRWWSANRCRGHCRRAFLARTPGASKPSSQLLPLASYPGVEGPPALSPDGNLVAFSWSGNADDDAPTDIYVKAVESEALRRLTETPSTRRSTLRGP